jgi:DNA-binding NarL/FixJ family response regulator
MPKIGGLTGLPGIRANSPRTKTLFLADFCDEEFINQALQHGAEGCLPKTAPPTELLKAVRTAHAGELWAQRRLVTRVVKSLCQRIDELQESLSWIRQVLTNREQEVLAWTAQGMTNKEIAAQLSISEKTVKTHLQNIFRKLNVRRRAQLPHFRLASPSRPAAITPGHPPSK